MLRSLREIIGYTLVDLSNNVVGRVADFFFDDMAWVVRYLVAETGVWLPDRQVLVSPTALGQPDWGGGVSLPVRLTKQQIEESPPVATNSPVSRQDEAALASYYHWPDYWNNVTFFDAQAVGMDPETYLRQKKEAPAAKAVQEEGVVEKTVAGEQQGDPHLRSVDEVSGYYIQAVDGDIGHVEDFIIDTETWVIRYLIIDTKNWWPGKKVLISPLWVDRIRWEQSEVFVGMSRDEIKNSPEFDPGAAVNRGYEERLYDFYGRPKYW